MQALSFCITNFTLLFLTAIFYLPVQAQISDKQVRLSIKDEIGEKINKIDTLLPAGADVDAVLLKMGYDAESVAKAYIGNHARRITVKTEEILPQKITAAPTKKIGTYPAAAPTAPPAAGSYKAQTTAAGWADDIINQNGDFDLNAILAKLPAGAVVEDTPDGKKITTVTTNANGEIETKELIIKTTRQTVSQNGNAFPTWSGNNAQNNNKKPLVIDSSPVAPLAETTQTATADNYTKAAATPPPPPPSGNNSTATYSAQNFGKYDNAAQLPPLQVAAADLDMFDNSTLAAQNPAILNYQPLSISDFSVQPDFLQGYYLFNFQLPPDKPADRSTTLKIYDAVGYLVYTESFMDSKYKKYIPEFHLYKKGTFLVLITADNKKYTRKITFE